MMMVQTKATPLNLALGQAGVYRVASELLMRGINIYFPGVDVGVDLVTEHGLRVQVKATQLAFIPSMKRSGYKFSLSWQAYGSTFKRRWRLRSLRTELDFLVFWCVDENRFFIVPSHSLEKASGVVLFPYQHKSYGKLSSVVYSCEGRWDLLVPALALQQMEEPVVQPVALKVPNKE